MSVQDIKKIAVIGSGIAGICSAYLLSRKYSVDIFESDSRIGGHTSTVVLEEGPDAGTPIDTGFIVLNDRTYPLLHKLLKLWDVPVRNADMSFGYHDERSGLMYGSRDLSMLLARRSNLLSPSFYRMVRGILRFWKELPVALQNGTLGNQSLKDFCGSKYSRDFCVHYLEPFAGAIWSASGKSVLDMPAELCARFFTNHGMLSYADNPQWQTVVGGSHSYLKAFEKSFQGSIFRGRRVVQIKRDASGVEVHSEGHGGSRYNAVVMATHADQALKLLGDPTPNEKRLLGEWTYSNNRTVLHTDTSFLPPLTRAIASWNYRRFANEDGFSPVCVTYHMNTLMGLKTKKNYCVTLNPRKEVASSEIVKEFNYTHPEFTTASFATQSQLPSLNGVQKTWFCGSYFRWGFHEDAVMSAVSVAKDFGIEL